MLDSPLPPEDGSTISGASLRFSTTSHPERDRIAAFREMFGRKIVHCEFEPLEQPFRADATLRRLPDLGLASIGHSLMRVGRSRSLLDDGDDALALQLTRAGGQVSQRGREAMIEPGGAVLTSNEEVFQFTGAQASHCLVLSLSRRKLRPLLGDFDAILVRRIPANTTALALLKHYISIFADTPALTPDVADLAVNHVYDLVAAALGATREAIEIANGRGIRAARLRAIKAYIGERLSWSGLTVDAVAVHHDITVRYVQMLFEVEGKTFSEYLVQQRLQHAHRSLLNPALAAQSITSVAFDAGFNDLSYFNRTFRRQFGCTPSEARVAGRRQKPM